MVPIEKRGDNYCDPRDGIDVAHPLDRHIPLIVGEKYKEIEPTLKTDVLVQLAFRASVLCTIHVDTSPQLGDVTSPLDPIGKLYHFTGDR